MSNKARDWARFVEGLTPVTGVVLRELAEFYNDEQCAAWPSIETLQAGCYDMNERTVRRSLSTLEKGGYIERTKRGTRHQNSVYIFNFNRTPGVVQPDTACTLPESSTGQSVQVNRTESASQPDSTCTSTGQSVHVIEEEPLRTIKEPLIEPVPVEVQPDIDVHLEDDDFFTRTLKAFETNIHLTTPIITAEIKAMAEDDSPPTDWGEKAVREAVVNNARNWAYVKKVLNRYIEQGSTEDRRKGRTNHAGPGSAIRGHADVSKYVAENERIAAARTPGNQL